MLKPYTMTFNVLYYSSSYIISQTYTIISLSVDMVNDISPPQQPWVI